MRTRRTGFDLVPLLLLVGAVLLDGTIPLDGGSVERLSGSFLLAAALAASAGCSTIRARFAIGLLAAIAMARMGGPPLLVVVVASAAVLTLMYGRSLTGARSAVLIAIALVASCRVLESTALVSRLLYELDELARSVSGAVTPGDAHMRLSAHYLGLLWMAALLVGVTTSGLSRRRVLVIASASILGTAGVWGAALAGGASRDWIVVALPILAPFIFGLGLALPDRTAMRRSRPRLASALAAVLLAGSVAHAMSVVPVRSGEVKRVGVLAVGLQDFERPAHGKYGGFTGGMFGRLPQWVAALGSKPRVVPRPQLASALQELDTLFLINLNEYLSDLELARIREFVAGGGTCVVLTDHTNVSGVQGPTNQVLEPHGIRARFDSAKNLCVWNRAFAPPTTHWATSVPRVGYMPYGIGCSFELSGQAQPVLKARHAFSDNGVPWNFVGAYLGNYRIDAGEDVGDQVVVASADYGDGTFVAFGDTTPFQNGPLVSAAVGFLRPFLEHAAGARRFGPVIGFLGVLAVAGWWIRSGRGTNRQLMVAGVLVAAGTQWTLPGSSLGSISAANLEEPLCVEVRVPPAETVPDRPAWKRSWALGRSAERGGFLVASSAGIEDGALASARVLLFVVPLATVPRQDEIVNFVRDGGHVVIVGGPRHLSATSEIARAAGITMDTRPRGPLPPGSQELEHPRFASAYALESAHPDRTRTLFRYRKTTAAVQVRLGRGSVIVVADDALPFADHIEGQSSWNLGNLAFFERMWSLLREEA